MDGGVLLRQVSSGCVGAHAVRLLRHPFAMGYCRDGYAHGDDPGMGTPPAWGHPRHVSDAAGSGDWAPPGCAGLSRRHGGLDKRCWSSPGAKENVTGQALAVFFSTGGDAGAAARFCRGRVLMPLPQS